MTMVTKPRGSHELLLPRFDKFTKKSHRSQLNAILNSYSFIIMDIVRSNKMRSEFWEGPKSTGSTYPLLQEIVVCYLSGTSVCLFTRMLWCLEFLLEFCYIIELIFQI